MNPNDPDSLLNELLADERLDKLRESCLEASLAEVRRARTWQAHRARLGLVLSVLVFAIALGWLTISNRPAYSRKVVDRASSVGSPMGEPGSVAEAPAQPKARIISDEELFALFPGRALALVGPPGKQELVFLDAVAQN